MKAPRVCNLPTHANSRMTATRHHASPLEKLDSLIHLLDGGATAPAATRCCTAGHATRGHVATATCGLVDFHHDRIHDSLQLLLLGLELVLLGELVLVQPIQSLLHGLLNLVLVIALELLLEFFLLQGVAHREAIVFQAILRLDLRTVRLVL